MKTIMFYVAILMVALAPSGCIPLMVGGYIGYEMSQHDAHAQWCAGHADDQSCHP